MSYWRLIAHHERAEDAATVARSSLRIAMGWGLIGDLAVLGPNSVSDITARVRAAYPHQRNDAHGGASLWRFYSQLAIGDLVLVGGPSQRIFVARVSGPYYWEVEQDSGLLDDYAHRRAIEPLDLDPERVWRTSGGFAPGENQRWTLARLRGQSA
jgi:predicted Mrr-cat superfamily restriction endonuclease